MRLHKFLELVAQGCGPKPEDLPEALACCWADKPVTVRLRQPHGRTIEIPVKSYEPGNTPDDL